MSPPPKLIASVLLLAAGGAVAFAAQSAPAHSRSEMIVCPLEPSGTVTSTCCGPPIVTVASAAFVCCGTPQQIACPIGLTLSPSSNPSVAGQKVTLTGRWPGSTASQTVALWQKLPGAKAFTKVAQTKTGSLGVFQFVRPGVETDRKWYVSAGSEHSPVVEQRVKAIVTFLLGSSLHGEVIPNHAGERVWVERRTGSGWTVTARARLTRKSTYGIAGSACAGLQRVVFPGDRRNARSASGERAAVCSAR